MRTDMNQKKKYLITLVVEGCKVEFEANAFSISRGSATSFVRVDYDCTEGCSGAPLYIDPTKISFVHARPIE